jgi:hypothetical protein
MIACSIGQKLLLSPRQPYLKDAGLSCVQDIEIAPVYPLAHVLHGLEDPSMPRVGIRD